MSSQRALDQQNGDSNGDAVIPDVSNRELDNEMSESELSAFISETRKVPEKD